MFTITSYFGFLLVALTITSALFIGLSKIRLISNFYLKETIQKGNPSVRFRVFYSYLPRKLSIVGH
nr:cytochrome b/f complex 3.5 kDa subunit [Eremophila splendens]UOI08002.1 cytochrome b/f complex 3.5 kDa subunit [Eremophila splendens]